MTQEFPTRPHLLKVHSVSQCWYPLWGHPPPKPSHLALYLVMVTAVALLALCCSFFGLIHSVPASPLARCFLQSLCCAPQSGCVCSSGGPALRVRSGCSPHPSPLGVTGSASPPGNFSLSGSILLKCVFSNLAPWPWGLWCGFHPSQATGAHSVFFLQCPWFVKNGLRADLPGVLTLGHYLGWRLATLKHHRRLPHTPQSQLSHRRGTCFCRL